MNERLEVTIFFLVDFRISNDFLKFSVTNRLPYIIAQAVKSETHIKNGKLICKRSFPGGATEKEKVVIDMVTGTAMDFFMALAKTTLFGSAEVGFINLKERERVRE